MSRGWVVDASVGVKLFLAEDLSEVAENLFFGPWNGRQRFFVPGAYVQEVDVHAVDLAGELRICVQPRLDAAPVVLGDPVMAKRL